MAEAVAKVKKDLGADAVIINSKEIVTGGFLGLFKKKAIEVIAANEQVEKKPTVITKVKQSPIVTSKNENIVDHQNKKREELKVQEDAQSKMDTSIETELKQLRNLVLTMSQSTSPMDRYYPEMIQKMRKILIEQEVNVDTIDYITKELVEKWYETNKSANEEEVKKWLIEILMAKVKDIDFGGISFTKKYVNVVGPTGVGKTTTLAKLAAHCVLNHKKRVAFITTDTYRIAAIDQLMTYAKILNVPLEVCYNTDDFQKATERFSHYDIVLIDTAGRNFRNKQYVDDLKQIVDFEKEMETFLVLALTSKQRDMMDIYQQFSSIKINKFIFTKVDETASYGAILNMVLACQLPVAYITNGQNVPDDLLEASPLLLMKTIVGENNE